MASINISETDFMLLAGAANLAQQNGNHEDAEGLDKIARKINAALSKSAAMTPFGRTAKSLGWQDMPSTLPPY